MADDPLARWERRTGNAATPTPTKQPQTARADSPTDSSADNKDPTRFRMYCLELRPIKGLWSWPAFIELRDFMADGENPSFVALLFHHMLVVIRGRNLESVIAGLRMRTQWVIEENAAPPTDPKAPYVESMEFITENIQASFTALRQTSKPKGKATETPATPAGKESELMSA